MSNILVYVLFVWIATVCMLVFSDETAVSIVGDQFTESSTIQHQNNSLIENLSSEDIELLKPQPIPEVIKVTEGIEQEIHEDLINLTLSDQKLPTNTIITHNNDENVHPIEVIQEENRIISINKEDISLFHDTTNEIDDTGNNIHESKMEFLLDELDTANKEIEQLKKENMNLTLTLNVKLNENNDKYKDEITLLNTELIEFKVKYDELYHNYINLENKYIMNNNTIKLLENNYNNDIINIQNKLYVSERNASLLEIKAHIARNEKNVARLSYENCLLELEATRHIQSDEMEALKHEIIEMKKRSSKSSTGSGCINNDQIHHPTISSSSNDKHPSLLNAVPDSDRHHQQQTSSSVCDVGKCFDVFVSQYLFFWAEEHHSQSKIDTSDSSGSSSSDSSSSSGRSSSANSIKHSKDTTILHSTSHSYLDSNPTVRTGIDYVQSFSQLCVVFYMNYIHPVVWQLLVLEAQVVSTVAAAVWHVLLVIWMHILSPFLFNTVLPILHTIYSTHLLPWYYTYIYPIYQTHAEVIVQKTINYILLTWETQYEAWFDRNILDITDFLVGRLHYIAYFTVQFIAGDDITGNLHSMFIYIQNFVPNLIAQLSSIPALQEQLGIYCELYLNILVYTIIILFIYIIRRILFGIAAFILLLVLSPVLLVLYCLVTPFLGKKKTNKKSIKSSNSSYSKGQRGNTGATVGGGRGGGAGPSRSAAAMNNQQQPYMPSYPPSTIQLQQQNYDGMINYSTSTHIGSNNSNIGSSRSRSNPINPFSEASASHQQQQQQWSGDFEL